MLQTSSPAESALLNQPQIALFSGSAVACPPSPSNAPCKKSAEFLEIFEELTGWQIAFQESPQSIKRRQAAGSEHEPPEGEFRVIDMSSQWPAQKPTAHRGQCDQLVGIFGELMNQLQKTRVELTRAHSALEAYSPGSIPEEEELVDSFVPKFGRRATDFADFDTNASGEFEANLYDAVSSDQFLYESHYLGDEDFEVVGEDEFVVVDPVHHFSDEDEFVVHQEVSGIHQGPKEAWKQWSIGGSTGMATDVYLDWFLNEEKLTICVGKLESSFGVGDAEVAIEIDPNEFKYRVSGATSIPAFYVWDRRGGQMQPVDTCGDWIGLPPGAAILSSTTPAISRPDPDAELSKSPSAEQMAKVLSRSIGDEEKVMVIKRV